jgi:hypothetical protein
MIAGRRRRRGARRGSTCGALQRGSSARAQPAAHRRRCACVRACRGCDGLSHPLRDGSRDVASRAHAHARAAANKQTVSQQMLPAKSVRAYLLVLAQPPSQPPTASPALPHSTACPTLAWGHTLLHAQPKHRPKSRRHHLPNVDVPVALAGRAARRRADSDLDLDLDLVGERLRPSPTASTGIATARPIGPTERGRACGAARTTASQVAARNGRCIIQAARQCPTGRIARKCRGGHLPPDSGFGSTIVPSTASRSASPYLRACACAVKV